MFKVIPAMHFMCIGFVIQMICMIFIDLCSNGELFKYKYSLTAILILDRTKWEVASICAMARPTSAFPCCPILRKYFGNEKRRGERENESHNPRKESFRRNGSKKKSSERGECRPIAGLFMARSKKSKIGTSISEWFGVCLIFSRKQ